MGDMCGVGEIDQDVHTKELKALHFLHLYAWSKVLSMLQFSKGYIAFYWV